MMTATRVKDLMECSPEMISPEATLQEAAQKMQKIDCGFLPVGTDKAPEGIITDRDIVIRAIADGKDPRTEKVRDYMTEEVCACTEDNSLEDAAKIMNENAVSRLVVKNAQGTICGVLTFGHILRTNDNRAETNTIVEQATGKAA